MQGEKFSILLTQAVAKPNFNNSVWPKSSQFSSAIMVVIGDTFPSIPAAREAVNRWLLDEGLSYHVVKSKKSSVYELNCLAEGGCTFHIKVWNTIAKGPTINTVITPYLLPGHTLRQRS